MLIRHKLILSSNQLDASQDPTVGLESLLREFDFKYARSFLQNYKAVLESSNLFSFLFLPTFYNIPALSFCCILCCLVMGFISKETAVKLMVDRSPKETSGYLKALEMLERASYSNYKTFFSYYGYEELDINDVIEDPQAFLDWIVSSEPNLQMTVEQFRSGSVFRYVNSVVFLNTGLDIHSSPYQPLLSQWCFKSFSDKVLGHNLNQTYVV